MRIVNNEDAGHLRGTVAAQTLNDASCIGTDYAVYVFAGDNVTPDDVDGVEPDPISTALLSNTFEYAVGFLDEGNYTLAFTCEANNDETDTNDVTAFIGTSTVTVSAGSTTTYNFD